MRVFSFLFTHSFNLAGNGSYIYVNVTAAKTNDVKLQTTVLKSDYCVRFFYHMYGADIGSLIVQTIDNYYRQVRNYFVRRRTQGDRWKEALFSVVADQYMTYYGYRVSLARQSFFS